MILSLGAQDEAWIKYQMQKGVPPKVIAHIMLLAELTDSSFTAVAERYDWMYEQVQRVVYGTTPEQS